MLKNNRRVDDKRQQLVLAINKRHNEMSVFDLLDLRNVCWVGADVEEWSSHVAILRVVNIFPCLHGSAHCDKVLMGNAGGFQLHETVQEADVQIRVA